MSNGLTRRQMIISGAAAIASFPKLGFTCGSEDRPLRVRKRKDLSNIDPATFVWDDEIIMRHVLAPLIRFERTEGEDNGRRLTPHIVNEIPTSENGHTRFRFTLRNERWSNGGSVTPRDVKFSFERIIDDEINSSHSNDWKTLQEVVHYDDNCGAIILNQPTPHLVKDILPYGVGCVVSREVVNGMANRKFTTNPGLTSGRYRIDENINGDRIVLKCDRVWSGTDPKFKKVIFKIIPDENRARHLYRRGELDVLDPDGTEFYRHPMEQLHDQYRSNVFYAPTSRIYFLGFNLRDQFLRRPNVRLAIQHAIDSRELATRFRNTVLGQANGLVPMSSWGSPTEPLLPFDPDETSRLMQSLGSPPPELTLTVWEGWPPFSFDLANEIRRLLQERGIQIRIVTKNFRTSYHTPRDQLFLGRVFAFPREPTKVLRGFTNRGIWSRLTGFDSTVFDDHFRELLSTSNLNGRISNGVALQRMLEEQGVIRILGEYRKPWLSRNVALQFTPFGQLADLGSLRF